MAIELSTPGIGQLNGAVAALREWQSDGAPWQLHPGDIGWFWRFGEVATAAAVRTWSRDGRILAVGLLDGATLLRMTMAPDAHQDDELTHHLLSDITDPERGVLPAGTVNIEAPASALIQDQLARAGWGTDEPWAPLRRDLVEQVEAPPGIRVEEIGPERADVWSAVQRASFEGSTFTPKRWHQMASGFPFADARCLAAFDDRGAAVATVIVWSAGHGRPGIIEPMGVHPAHRGHSYGTAITVAAAVALRKLGCSSAQVYTESSNVGAVATYVSAGFARLPEVRDRRRDS